MKKRNFKLALIISLAIGCGASIAVPGPGTTTAQAASIGSFFTKIFHIKTKQDKIDDLGLVENVKADNSKPNELTFSWDAKDGAEGYKLTVTHNGETVYDKDVEENTYNMKGLTAGAVYTYTVSYYKTVDRDKLCSNPTASQQVATAVSNVSGVRVTSRSASTVSGTMDVAWEKQGEASYHVYYKKTADTTDYTLAADVTTNAFQFTNLELDTQYSVKIVAYVGTLIPGDITSASEEVLATCPAQISNFQRFSSKTNEITLSWDTASTNYYQIYRSDTGADDSFAYVADVNGTNTYTDTGLTAGKAYYYKVCTYSTTNKITGPMSETVTAYTTPYKINNLKVVSFTSKNVTITWDKEDSADGYLVYRMHSGDYTLIGTTTDTTYSDDTVNAGTNYRYKVCGYKGTQDNVGELSDYLRLSTIPASPALKTKAGDSKIRLYWKAVTGATGYYVYQLQADGSFTLIQTLTGKSSITTVISDLELGEEYSFMVTTYRVFETQTLVSENSVTVSDIPETVEKTSTAPYLYSTKKKLQKAASWAKVSLVKKYAVYDKSYVIPGLKNTNVNGLTTSNMCPQGMCFAKNYLLISAYDKDGLENSVIYVMSKSTRKLLTVIVLDNTTHAGGICFDGSTVWVTYGSSLCALPFSKINSAAKAKKPFACVSFSKTLATSKASFVTYYKKQYWVGSYVANSSGVMKAYKKGKDDNGKTIMVEQTSMTIPSRCQGAVFKSNGQLILSRAYNYTHQLDLYKPKKASSTTTNLGSQKKKAVMPFLNEEIDISGSYIFVNFESAVSPAAPDHMDRILSFKVNKILK